MLSSDITVTYRGSLAHYQIFREAPGLYAATLIHYRGEVYDTPTSNITLLRGIRQWTGSIDDEGLLAQLGAKIEQALANSSFRQVGG